MMRYSCRLLPVGLFSLVALATGVARAIPASFMFEATTPITLAPNASGPHGLAFDGVQWHVANSGTNVFTNHNASFSPINQSSVAGISDMRGMTYDASAGTLFVGDLDTTIVRQVSLSGAFISQFSGDGFGGLNALAYDQVTDSIWLAYFSNGVIENRTKNGLLISTFSDPAYQWTGLAVDHLRRTLLALETDDTLIEYELDGTKLGVRLGADLVPGNGQGLAYDAGMGRLFVTSQIPDVVTTFLRVPEAASRLLLGIGAVSLLGPTRRPSTVRRKIDC